MIYLFLSTIFFMPTVSSCFNKILSTLTEQVNNNSMFTLNMIFYISFSFVLSRAKLFELNPLCLIHNLQTKVKKQAGAELGQAQSKLGLS